MKRSFFRLLFVLLIAGLTVGSFAFAHLMVAQRGTLNLSGDGAYLVVSVATSSLTGVNDDGDGLLSAEELNNHKASIIEQLKEGLQLSDNNGLRPLEGIMLSLSPADGQEGNPADQLIVMGRYALKNTDDSLSFRANLWGSDPSEQSLSLTVTKDLEDERLIVVTPQQPQVSLYASFLRVMTSYLKLGGDHVFAGLDHLLFLLIVVSAGWGWKKVLTALSVFTLGHALSLLAVVFAGLRVPTQIVEPVIAATIIGLALYDFWLARTKKTPPISRLTLVFACSLIHGLGLGGALNEIGVNPAHQVATLLGFNIGIELAQLSVAVSVLTVFALLRAMWGNRSVQLTSSFMTFTGVLGGAIWFIERLM